MLVALSILGNFISSTYAVARVKQEIGKLRILPFSRFWARQSRFDTPVGGLALHWLVAAGFITITPAANMYGLVTDLFVYGQQWVVTAVVLGLVALRAKGWEPAVVRWSWLRIVLGVYATASIGVGVLAWWPSAGGVLAPTILGCLVVVAAAYWTTMFKLLPMLGFAVESRPDELVDGSRVVTFSWGQRTGFARRIEERWMRRRGGGQVGSQR